MAADATPASTSPAPTEAPAAPPLAERRPHRREHHGDVFDDDYEWLRDKDDPQVIAHLDAENAYTDARTAHLAVLEEQLFDEIRRTTKETDLSVPVREGGYWYYRRTVEGMQYGIRCRIPVTDHADWMPPALPDDGGALPGEEVLLDENVEADGHEYFALGSFDVSDDGRRLLWAVDTVGDERYTLRVREIGADGAAADLRDEIPNTAGGAFFAPGGRYLFYTTVDESWRPDTVWRHEVGTAAADDTSVFHEDDERYWVGAGLTRSRKYLVIQLGSKITSEARVLDASDPTGEFTVVWPRREGVEYDIEHAVIDDEDRLLITHNDGAEDFELVSVPVTDPGGRRDVLVPHRPGTRIEGVDAFAGFLALEYRRDTLTRVAVAELRSPRGEGPDPTRLSFHELEFDEELYTVGAGGNPEWEQPTLRLGYGSFVTPSTVLSYDVATGERTVLKQQPVLGGYDPSRYAQRREWVDAADGTRIPVSLLYRTDLVPLGEDGVPAEPAPTVLYGYGAYEHSIDPGFSIPRLGLLDRGVVFAVAHVRGGGELGRAWYERGKLHDKPNTFSDFVDVAHALTERGWTAPERLVAEGGSAGGLLMGAAANLAPDAFAGVLAVVPFVDPLTSILDPELPLTVIEWDEWGDPLHDPEVYALMKSYSPYENVRDVRYPRILAVTSLNDTRVLYVEPAKWVARLRAVGEAAGMPVDVLLRCEMSAGHGGVSGRYAAWRKRAFELAWVLDVLGVHPS